MSQIISVKRVKDSKEGKRQFQAELTDTINVSGRVNVLGRMNKGDDRFRLGSLQHVWFAVTLLSLEELGFSKSVIDTIDKLEFGQKHECKFESPKLDGEELTIQIVETIEGSEYQKTNSLKAAKQIKITDEIAANKNLASEFVLSDYVGQTGYFVDANGNFIYRNSSVTVASQCNHITIEGAMLVPTTEMRAYGTALAEDEVINTFKPSEEEKEEVGA